MNLNLTSYAQNFEDIYIYKMFQTFKNYYDNPLDWTNFIDIGVWEPIWDNVSKNFIDLHWQGLLVEANPYFVEKLNLEYSQNVNVQVLNFAVSSTNQNNIRLFIPEKTTGWASCNEDHVKRLSENYTSISVPAITLNDLIQFLGRKIFYIKLDIETLEEEILRTYINDGNVILFVVEGVNKNIIELMWEKNFYYSFNDGINGYFVNNSFSKISKPKHVNVVDDAIWRLSANSWLVKDLMKFQSQIRGDYNKTLNELSLISDENKWLKDEYNKTLNELSLISDENKWLKDEYNKTLNELSLIVNSRSMKITRPIRKIKKLLFDS